MSDEATLKKQINQTENDLKNLTDHKHANQAKLASLNQKLRNIQNKPANVERRKKAFCKWTTKHGYLLFGMPHTKFSNGNQSDSDTDGYGGFNLKNNNTIFTLWTKFNLKPLRLFSSHQSVFLNSNSEKQFIKAYARRICVNSDAYKIANTIIDPSFHYGYVEFYLQGIGGEDISALVDSKNPDRHVMAVMKDVSHNIIWSKKSIKEFAYDLSGYNPMFAKMIKTGATRYRHYVGFWHNEIADIPANDPMNYDPKNGHSKPITIKGKIM